MPFTRHNAPTPVDMLPGIVRRTMTAGDNMMLIEVHPGHRRRRPHAHPPPRADRRPAATPGRMRLQIALWQELDLDPGDADIIPGGAEHEATALEPAGHRRHLLPAARGVPLTQRVRAGFKPAAAKAGFGIVLVTLCDCVISSQ